MMLQLRWTGLSTRHGDRGAPKKRFKDILRKSLAACSCTPQCMVSLHLPNFPLRRSIFKDKRQMRKTREASAPTPDQTFSCGRCRRTCLSLTGLVSHERACSRCGPSPPPPPSLVDLRSQSRVMMMMMIMMMMMMMMMMTKTA